MCKPMGQSRRKCSITLIFFHICIKKGVCYDFVWCDEHLRSIISKMKNFDLDSYFCITWNQILYKASFSHAGTHVYTKILVNGNVHFSNNNYLNYSSLKTWHNACISLVAGLELQILRGSHFKATAERHPKPLLY